MNKGVIKDKKVWKTILEFLPGSADMWSGYAKISRKTLQGWKQEKNCPREDTLMDLLMAMEKHLTEKEKEKLTEQILESVGITKNAGRRSFKVKAKEDFANLIRDVLKQSSSLESIYYDKNPKTELVNMLLLQKLQYWFLSEPHISVEPITSYDRSA